MSMALFLVIAAIQGPIARLRIPCMALEVNRKKHLLDDILRSPPARAHARELASRRGTQIGRHRHEKAMIGSAVARDRTPHQKSPLLFALAKIHITPGSYVAGRLIVTRPFEILRQGAP